MQLHARLVEQRRFLGLRAGAHRAQGGRRVRQPAVGEQRVDAGQHRVVPAARIDHASCQFVQTFALVERSGGFEQGQARHHDADARVQFLHHGIEGLQAGRCRVQQSQGVRRPVAIDLQQSLVGVDAGQRKAVACRLQGRARLREIGKRGIVAVLCAARAGPPDQRPPALARIIVPLQRRQRLLRPARNGRRVVALVGDVGQRVERLCAQDRRIGGAAVGQQCRECCLGLVEPAGAELQLRQLLPHFRTVAVVRVHAEEDPARAIEVTGKKRGADLLHAPGKVLVTGDGRRIPQAHPPRQARAGQPRRGDDVRIVRLDAHVAAGDVEDDGPARAAADGARRHDAASLEGTANRRGIQLAVLVGTPARHGDHVVARYHRQPGGTQLPGHEVHHAQAHPAERGRRLHLYRQHHGCAGRRLHARCIGRIGRMPRAHPPARHHQQDDGGHDQAAPAKATRRSRCNRRNARLRGRRIRRPGRRRGWRGGQRLLRRRRYLFHRCDPAITKTRHRADDALAVRAAIVERAPRLQHHLAERVVADLRLAPDRGDQFIAPDRALALRQQVGDGIEGLGRRRLHVVPAQQQALGGIEQEAAEAVRGRRHRGER